MGKKKSQDVEKEKTGVPELSLAERLEKMEVTLENCPACNYAAEAKSMHANNGVMYSIQCSYMLKCPGLVQTRWHLSLRDAAASWNNFKSRREGK